jgi:chaperonin GroEL
VVKDAAARTAKEAGDGTTTSTILACRIAEIAFYNISNGDNPMDIKRGIDLASEYAVEKVNSMARNIEDDEQLRNIATISANNDKAVGSLIADVFRRVGETGAVRIEETQQTETSVDVTEGGQFNAGWLSPNFQNNVAKQVADYRDAMIFITDKKFETSFMELAPVMEIAAQAQKPILLITGGMEGEPLGTLVFNKMKSSFPVVAVTAPEFGDKRVEILEDIAAITGGTVISEARGHVLEEMTIDQFGTADRIIVSADFLTILGRNGDEESITERVNSIEYQKKEDRHGQNEWYFNRRIATLTGGIGIIYVGGNSETEARDKYFRVEDAVHATKAAMEDGYVLGGGLAYEILGGEILDNLDLFDIREGILNGASAVANALGTPLARIVGNAGAKYEDRGNMNQGYDALNDKWCDLYEAGIIDPVKVVKSAIKNACSVAGMLVTTDCIITNAKK